MWSTLPRLLHKWCNTSFQQAYTLKMPSPLVEEMWPVTTVLSRSRALGSWLQFIQKWSCFTPMFLKFIALCYLFAHIFGLWLLSTVSTGSCLFMDYHRVLQLWPVTAKGTLGPLLQVPALTFLVKSMQQSFSSQAVHDRIWYKLRPYPHL